MIQNYSDFLKRLSSDTKRILVLIFVVGFISVLDDIIKFSDSFAFLSSVLTSSAIVLCIAAVSHLTRRVLFPTIDLQKFAKESLDHPIGAALIFLSVSIVLATLIIVNVLLLS